jgi:WD40 repeat protein
MSSTVTHEIKRFARCISAHTDANESYHGFLVSTANLRGPNEIRLLRYREDGEELRCVALWSHDYEVLSLNGCPTDGSLLSTVYNTLDGKGGKGTVWRLAELPEGLGGEDSGGAGLSGGQDPLGRALERVCDLPLAAGGGGSGEAASPSAAEGVDPLHHLQWAPAAQDHKAGTMVSAHSGSVRCWSLDNGKAAETWCVKFEAEASFLGGVAWDPHHPVEVSVATDGDVSSWDMRTGEKTRSIAAVAATTGCIRGLSYNPNKPWHLATCGDDFRVKIWDLRRCAAPIKILDGHSHWCVACSPPAHSLPP